MLATAELFLSLTCAPVRVEVYLASRYSGSLTRTTERDRSDSRSVFDVFDHVCWFLAGRAGETSLTENEFGLNLRYDVVFEEEPNGEVIEGTESATETRRRRARGPRAMVEQKKRRREGTDTDQGEVKALRQEIERLREENEGLKLTIAKVEAECQAPQEEEKEVELPTEVWAIIAGKLDENDVCSFALVSKQLREAQVLAGKKLVTRPWWKRTKKSRSSTVSYFTEDWCAYWSKKFNVHHTDPKLIKRVLYVAARHGYLQVFEKYWSQGPKKRLSQLWDERTCYLAAEGGHLEVIKWLRAKRCPWESMASGQAARGGHLEVLQWMRAQDPPCPWDSDVCYSAASGGHLEVLRWARSQGCPWDKKVLWAAAEGGHLEVLQWMRAQDPPCPWNSDVYYAAARKGHLEVLRWARSQGCPWSERVPRDAAKFGQLKVLKWLIKEGCPYYKSWCREAAVKGGQRARKVLEWLDK